MMLGLGLLLIAAAPPTAIAPLPAEAVRFHATHIARVQPPVRSWIAEQAKKARQAPPGAVTEASLAGEARARFAGQNFGNVDVETLVQLVMMEMAREAEQDLKAALAEMKAANEKKQKLSEAVEKAKKQRADAAGKPGTARCVPPACGGFALGAKEPATLDELRALADELKRQADSLGDLSQEMQLKLQMYMDRYAKLVEMLSNLMKKLSDTSQSIISNLK